MKFKEFINTLTAEEVNATWESIEKVPQDAIINNWKYSLKRENKIVPVKWFVNQLALEKKKQIDFQSSYDNRDVFASKFGFTIHEDLVFDKQDFKRFQKFYDSQVKNKSLFQFFVEHCHNVLISVPINPYKVRMAITQQNEAMVIVGMRAVLSYKSDRVGFILKSSNFGEIDELYNLEKDYDFKDTDGVSFFYTRPGFIPDTTVYKLLELNSDAIADEYWKVENSIRSRWNVEATTTNHTLKKILFENENINVFLNKNTSIVMDYFLVDEIALLPTTKDKIIKKDTFVKLEFLQELLEKALGRKFEGHYILEDHNCKTFDIGLKVSEEENSFMIILGFLDAFTQYDDGTFFKLTIVSIGEHYNNLEVEINSNWAKYFTIDNFPQDWQTLVDRIAPNLKEIVKLLENSFVHAQIRNSGTMNYPLNQILFGCPGSGKTYSTKKLTVEIIEDRKFGNTKEDREEILRLYEHYSDLNQIRFTTFHQSLGYEDFIEGIKPIIEEDENGKRDVLYEIQDGILKKIAIDAGEKKYSSTEIQTEYTFDDAWDELVDTADKALENRSSVVLDIQTPGMGMKILAITDRGNLIVKPSLLPDDSNKYTVSYSRAKKLQKAFPTLSTVKNIDKEFRQVIGGSNSTAYWAVVNYINRKIEEISKSQTIKNELTPVPYVLIIDEINRGNVSAVFGELITLIEDDKRLGSTEAIEVILPYSKENFGIPPNLYLIGTMNTADRSVEALDTALRRRFSFTEMKSDPQVLVLSHDHGGIIPDTNINLIVLLETINQRIELLVDKDHQIGHSYFIKVNTLEDLKHTFKNKIIPLLEEYFYGDFGKIGLVLGDRFVSASAANDNKKILAKFTGYDDVDFLTDKKIYSFADIDALDASDFISIYQDNTVSQTNEF